MLKLLIIEGSGPSLLGCHWLRVIELDWWRIFHIWGKPGELTHDDAGQIPRSVLECHKNNHAIQLTTWPRMLHPHFSNPVMFPILYKNKLRVNSIM